MRFAPAATLFFITLVACSNSHEVVMRSHSIAHRIDRVFVGTRGTVALNGKLVTAKVLADELVKLKAADGTLWYSRENATIDPTDAQLVVFKLIVSSGVPIALFRDATFTGSGE